jgi:pyruvate-formate lyase
VRSSTETLIAAMWILSRDIKSTDGIANAAVAEAAERLAELQEAERKQQQAAQRLLACIRELATNRAITDTVWLGDRGITVCEELAGIAVELGADEGEVETILGCGPTERNER